jgi:hypothetical protein
MEDISITVAERTGQKPGQRLKHFSTKGNLK